MNTMKRLITVSILLIIGMLVISGCSGKDENEESSLDVLVFAPGRADDVWSGKPIVEIAQAVNGSLEGSAKFTVNEMGIDTANYVSTAAHLLQGNHDLFVVPNEQLYRNIEEVITENPDVMFLVFDAAFDSVPTNVIAVQYRDEEAAYISGALAAKATQQVNGKLIGYLGGFYLPKNINDYYGFLQGVTNVEDLQVIQSFIESDSHYVKAKYMTEMMVDSDVSVVYQNIGKASLGAVDATNEMDIPLFSAQVDLNSKLNNVERARNLAMSVERKQEVILADLIIRIQQGEELGGIVQSYGFKEGAFELVPGNLAMTAEDSELFKEAQSLAEQLKGGEEVVRNYVDHKADYDTLRKQLEGDMPQADLLKYSVEFPFHEADPNIPDATDWKAAPRIGLGMKPIGWSSGGLWATFYLQDGMNYVDNVAIEIKDFKQWGYSPSQEKWVQLSHALPRGAFYYEDFKDDHHVFYEDRVRFDEENLSAIVLLDKFTQGRNYHPFSEQYDLEAMGMADITYVISQVKARLVKWDENGPDNLERAKYTFNVGGDWWVRKGARWNEDWSANGDMAIGQYRSISTEWKTAYMTTVPSDMFDTIVPADLLVDQ